MTILVLVQGFSLEAATAKTSFVSDVCSRTMILYNGTHAANQYIFLRFSRVSFSYKDSLSKVLMSDMLTTTTESIPTTNVHSCMRILYKGTHVANQNCSWGFKFLIPAKTCS